VPRGKGKEEPPQENGVRERNDEPTNWGDVTKTRPFRIKKGDGGRKSGGEGVFHTRRL